MESGSPCVVPSREYNVWPSAKSSVGLLFVFTKAVAIEGHSVKTVLKRYAAPTVACFYDLSKAFDRLWHDGLIKKTGSLRG